MVVRIVVLFILMVATGYPQAKVGTTGAQFLELSPSVRTNGMGEIGVMLTDNQAFCYNPAALGMTVVKHISFSFNPLAAMLHDTNVGWRSLGFVARLDQSDRAMASGFRVAVAYYYTHLNSGAMVERTYNRGVDYPDEGIFGTGRTFEWNDYLHRLAAGVGWHGKVDFAIGFTDEYIREKVEVLGAEADTRALTLGAMLRIDLGSNNSGMWRPPELTVGASYSHWGRDLTFISKPAPIPKIGRIGAAVQFTRVRDGRAQLSLLPAIEWEVLFTGKDEGIWKGGIEIEYLELISGRLGYVMPDGDPINRSTYGLGFSTLGLRQRESDQVSSSAGSGGFFRYLADNVNIELSFAHVGAQVHGWKGTNYCGIEVTL